MGHHICPWFKSERFVWVYGALRLAKTSNSLRSDVYLGYGYMDGPNLKVEAGTTAYAATVIFASAGFFAKILDNVKTVDPRDAIDLIGT